MSRKINSYIANNKTRTDTIPEWKRQGYASYEAYLMAQKGQTATPKPVTPSLNNYSNTNVVGAYGSSSTKPVSVTINSSPNSVGGITQTAVPNIKQESSQTEMGGKSTHVKMPNVGTNAVIVTPKGGSATLKGADTKDIGQVGGGGSTPNLENYNHNEPEVKQEVVQDDEPSVEPMPSDSKISKANAYWDEQRKLLEDNYGVSQKALDNTKKASQQNASIAYDKLLKYLPNQLEEQGLSGLGIGATLEQKVNNDYLSQMGKIASDHSVNSSNLGIEKNNAISELERYRQADFDKIEAEEKAREAEERARVEAEQADTYNYARDIIGSGAITTEEDLHAFVYSLKGKVNDIQYENLVSYGTQMIKVYEKTATENNKADILEQFYTLMEMGQNDAASKFLENNGEVFSEQEKKIYRSMLSSIGYMTEQEVSSAKDELQNYIDNGETDVASDKLNNLGDYLTDDEKSNYNNKIEQGNIKNSIKTTSLSWNNDGTMGAPISEWTTLSIKDSSGNKYRVKYGEKVTDSNLIEVVKGLGIKENSVFGYNNQIYVMKNDNVYLVEMRNELFKQHYNNLYNAIFG